ncbi:insulinase family protein [Candidatus Saccharibacteria bacterium]|nr:insulinase family protein [Candidatus Saccharibacteria bacterium]
MNHKISKIDLSNGSKGLLIHIPDATVMTFEINFRAGDYLVDHQKWETPHLMEHILLGANELYPKSRDFQAELEKNGAYANASTGSYDITYEAECADFEWDRILGLLITAISKPLFLQEEFDSEFGNVREELFSRSNNHFRHLNLALRKEYGFVALTDQERLQLMSNVNVSDVREHYSATHRTPNMRFVIAGNITKSRKEIIEKLLSNIELSTEGYRTPLPDETPNSLPKPLYIENSSVENMYFYLDTFIRRRITDSESYAMMLANVILTETLHSRIYGQAREKGLVYGVSSNYARLLGSSNFWLGAQVMPGNIGELFKIILTEINNLKQGKFSEDELKASKLFALGRFQRGAQTVASTANLYSSRYFYEEEVEDYFEIPDKIQAVTKNQLEAVINTIFSENIKGFGVLGSCGEKFVDSSSKILDGLWLRG